VKILIIVIGSVLIFLAVLGYTIGPSLVTNEIKGMTGGDTDTSMATSILSQMGIPPIDEMVKIAQYSFVGLGVIGIGAIMFGIISKKYKQQFVVPEVELAHHDEMKEKSNAFNILQERLSKGEITSSQYQNLKRHLEEDNKK
jgi:hypothetical protein